MTEQLKRIRQKMGMNMREFAGFLGVKYTTYVGYENGSREPGAAFLTHAAQCCGTTTDYLLGIAADDRMPPSPQLISFTGSEDPLRIMLSEAEYLLIRAWRAADERAREDVQMLLDKHKRQI